MCLTIERLLNIKSAQCPPTSGCLPRRRDRGATGSWCKEEMSGCLVPASSQMFCGSLCKPTCICLLAFQNVCYHCIHYGLGRSWTPTPPSLSNKLYDWDGRYFNTEGEWSRLHRRDVARLENQSCRGNLRGCIIWKVLYYCSLLRKCKIFLDSSVKCGGKLAFSLVVKRGWYIKRCVSIAY